MLVSLLRELGCEVRHVAHVSDTMEAVLSTISLNLYHDALFITGGMSMGEFDFVPRALIELGAKLEISKLKIKPGKPFVYTRLGWTQENASGTCHIFGLPGNPVSAYVCTVRLATRILNRIAGGPPDGPIIHAALTTDLPANGPRELYLPSVLNGNEITPLSPNGSADIFTLAKANALLIRGENAATAKAGDLAAAIRIMPCGL
jgi:molybdopterin molybdotransferase